MSPPLTWEALSDEQQLAVTREAMRRAAETLAGHAEMLAEEFDEGRLTDRGGAEALRLFAAVVRATQQEAFGPVGHA